MAGSAVLRQVQQLFQRGSPTGMSEGQLLERFRTSGDEAAFEAIVAWHGPMVLGVCRRWLVEPADVEDAFQATFLILLRRARELRRADLLGPWLHGVAYRVAVRARARNARRMSHEQRVLVEPVAPEGGPGIEPDVRRVLDEEIERLPEPFRSAIVLHYLEGFDREESARRLGCPVGTLDSRLGRARERLRGRLTRRGLAPEAGIVATSGLEAGRWIERVPEALTGRTVALAKTALSGGSVPAAVAALVKGGLKAMFPETLKRLAATGLVALLLAGGAAAAALALARSDAKQDNPDPPTAQDQAGSDDWSALNPDAVPETEQRVWRNEDLVALVGTEPGQSWDTIRDMAISPDGRTIVTGGSGQGALRLWDASSLRERAALVPPRRPDAPYSPEAVNQLWASWRGTLVGSGPDGKRLVSLGSDQTIRLWDVSANPPNLLDSLWRYPGEAFSLQVSPDGKMILTVNRGDVVAWRWGIVEDKLVRKEALPWSPGNDGQAFFLDDGDSVATFGGSTYPEDDAARGRGEMVSGRLTLAFWQFGPRVGKGKTAAEAAYAKQDPPQDARTSAPIGWMFRKRFKLPDDSPRIIGPVALSPDRETLALMGGASNGRVVELWDLRTDPPTRKHQMFLELKGCPPLFNAELGFSNNGEMLLASVGYQFRLWDVTGKEPRELWNALQEATYSYGGIFGFSPDGKTVYQARGSELASRAVAEPPKDRDWFETDPSRMVNGGLAFTPDGKAITLEGGNGGLVRFWNMSGARPLKDGGIDLFEAARKAAQADQKKKDEWIGGLIGLFPSPDRRFLGIQTRLPGGADHLEVWSLSEAAPPRRLADFPTGFGGVSSVAFAPDGRHVASLAFMDWKITIRDLQTPEAEPHYIPQDGGTSDTGPSRNHLQNLAYSPDGTVLVTGNADRTVRVWDIRGEEAREIAVLRGLPGRPRCVAFSADGSRLFVGDETGLIRLWKFPEMSGDLAIQAHYGEIVALRLSPDGRLLLSADAGGLVIVRDASTLETLDRWMLPGPIWAAAFSPDGKHVVTGNGNGSLAVLERK